VPRNENPARFVFSAPYGDNVTRAEYHGDGPVLPGEDVHQALGANTVQSLAGHMLPPAPGHGFEDELTDNAEKAAEQTAQKPYTFNHAQTAASIRAALRASS
jgi:hypothetical protein